MDVPHEKMMIKHRILGYIGYPLVIKHGSLEDLPIVSCQQLHLVEGSASQPCLKWVRL